MSTTHLLKLQFDIHMSDKDKYRNLLLGMKPFAITAGQPLMLAGQSLQTGKKLKKNIAKYVQKQHKSQQEKLQNANAVSQTWNRFNEQCGTFSDEHSTL